MNAVIHVDGGARGNPGPAGAGVVIHSVGNELLFEGAYFLGEQTNNSAEYRALLFALERAQALGLTNVEIRSDSELLVRQITGEYRVKNPGLQKLYEQAQILLVRVGRWTLRHVRREENRRADELANLAMDRRTSVVVFDRSEAGAPGAAPQSPLAAKPADAPPVAAPPITTAAADALGGNSGAGLSARARVTLAGGADADGCVAGRPFPGRALLITNELPAGVCVYAAHAVVPTVLALLNTAQEEFVAVPTMTVRCARPGCAAVFHCGMAPRQNGMHE